MRHRAPRMLGLLLLCGLVAALGATLARADEDGAIAPWDVFTSAGLQGSRERLVYVPTTRDGIVELTKLVATLEPELMRFYNSHAGNRRMVKLVDELIVKLQEAREDLDTAALRAYAAIYEIQARVLRDRIAVLAGETREVEHWLKYRDELEGLRGALAEAELEALTELRLGQLYVDVARSARRGEVQEWLDKAKAAIDRSIVLGREQESLQGEAAERAHARFHANRFAILIAAGKGRSVKEEIDAWLKELHTQIGAAEDGTSHHRQLVMLHTLTRLRAIEARLVKAADHPAIQSTYKVGQDLIRLELPDDSGWERDILDGDRTISRWSGQRPDGVRMSVAVGRYRWDTLYAWTDARSAEGKNVKATLAGLVVMLRPWFDEDPEQKKVRGFGGLPRTFSKVAGYDLEGAAPETGTPVRIRLLVFTGERKATYSIYLAIWGAPEPDIDLVLEQILASVRESGLEDD